MPYACQRCGLTVPQGRNVCPNCGAIANRPDAVVRCQHCYHRAPSHLSVCPNCGRKLNPLRADAPVALASLLALLLLWVLFRGSGSLGEATSTGAGLVEKLAPATVQAVAEGTQTLGNATPSGSPLFVNPTATPEPPTPTTLPTETPTTIPPTVAISATLPVTATVALTATIESSPMVVALTATPTATPTPLPATATATATAAPTLAPTATPTRAPSATPTTAPGASPSTYVVQAGDTMASIAERLGRTVQAMAAFNNIVDVRRLSVGQVLKVPPADYVPPAPTATPPRPTATVTPTLPPQATPTPAISIAAPELLTPGDNATFRGPTALIEMKWRNPGFFPADGQNVLHIGIVTGPGQVEWRLNEPLGSATDAKVPGWLFDAAPQELGRSYVWYVQVESGGSPVSPPSSQWRFQWD